MYEDSPQELVWDLLTDLLYGDQPAGWNILGTKKTVKSIYKKDLSTYRHKHYVASSTVVIVAGKFDEKKISAEVNRAFSGISRAKKNRKKKVVEQQSTPRSLIKYQKTSQTHLVLGFRSYNIFHSSYSAVHLLAGILGKGMSSRLFHKVREELGAGYYVGANNDFFTDHGFFACYAGVDNKRVSEVIQAILETAKDLKHKKVSSDELDKTKNFLIGNMFLGLESSSALASFYGKTEVLQKKLKTPQEVADEVRSVTAEQVQKIAEDIFQNKKLNLALIGPLKDKKQFSSILNV